MHIFPGLPRWGIKLIDDGDGEEEDANLSDEQTTPIGSKNTFRLLGFVKNTTIVSLPCIFLNYSVQASGARESQLNYFALAESMVAENSSAILEHDSGEQCVMIPQRDDSALQWEFRLQFFHSSKLEWHSEKAAEKRNFNSFSSL